MAARRHPSSSALLVVLGFFLAAVPGLYLFQAIFNKARKGRQHLVANLMVRLNDRTPHHLDLGLHPPGGEDADARRIELLGTARLRGGTYPWKEAPIEARLQLVVSADRLESQQAPFRLGTGGQGLSATYQEHYLASAEEPWSPVPCIGTMEVAKLVLDDEGFVDWGSVHTLQGQLELQCHGSGRDLQSSTADDLHFTIIGTVDYAFSEAT